MENNKEMNLQDALALITQYGLTVTSSTGEVKAKPKKKISNRRPKGSGSIVFLGKGRSKPYGAFVTVGYDDENGKQVQRAIGYYQTREQAQTSLDIYNSQRKGIIQENIINLDKFINDHTKNNDKRKIPTFNEIWEIIFENEISKKAYSTMINYRVGYNNVKDLHNIRIDKINLHTLQPIFDKVMKKGSGESKLNMMKVVCKSIFKYAIKYDYIEKDYSTYINFKSTNDKIRNRKALTKEEIELLKNDNTIESKLILIAILTGLRPKELVNIRKDNIFLEENYLIAGMKTKNGINRTIPLHHYIKPFIIDIMKHNKNSEYLIFKFNGTKAYEEYRKKVFHTTMNRLGIENDPYNTRHTFATISKLAGVNEFARKKIMGHSCNDLTDDIYTHAPTAFLVEEINKISI